MIPDGLFLLYLKAARTSKITQLSDLSLSLPVNSEASLMAVASLFHRISHSHKSQECYITG